MGEQIDSWEGLIQLVGPAYGAEPPEVNPDYGRVSYTQFEFFYAQCQGKKTWIILAGEQCHRDKPPETAEETHRRELAQRQLRLSGAFHVGNAG